MNLCISFNQESDKDTRLDVLTVYVRNIQGQTV